MTAQPNTSAGPQAAGNAPPSPEAIGGKGKEAGAGLALGFSAELDARITEIWAGEIRLILQRQANRRRR